MTIQSLLCPQKLSPVVICRETNLLKSSLQFITLLGLRHCTLCTLAQLHKWDMAHNWKIKETPIICCWWEMRMHKRPFPLKLAAATSTQLNKAATSSSWDQNMFSPTKLHIVQCTTNWGLNPRISDQNVLYWPAKVQTNLVNNTSSKSPSFSSAFLLLCSGWFVICICVFLVFLYLFCWYSRFAAIVGD